MSFIRTIRVALLTAQNGSCAICLRQIEGTGALDHDHAVSKRVTPTSVRGVLCTGCNYGLGNFRDDAIALMRAVDYLKPIQSTDRPLSLRVADLHLDDNIATPSVRPEALRPENLPRELQYALLALDVRRVKTLIGEWYPTPEEELEVTKPEFREALSVAFQVSGLLPR